MRKSYTNSERIMFKIDVKIGPRILTLNVSQGDTITGLLTKNNIVSQFDSQRLKELKDKIMINIQKQIQIKLYSNQLDLAKRMENFLNKQIEKVQPLRFKEQRCQIVNYQERSLQKQTPFKMLFERTQNFTNINHPTSLSLPKSVHNSQNKTLKSDHNQSFRQSTGPINQINHLNPKHHNINQSKKKHDYLRYSQSNQKVSSRKVDDDLIKAYEIILKKSKDKAMRQMAERTLKELNVNVYQGDVIKTQQFQVSPQGEEKGVKQKHGHNQTKPQEVVIEKQNITRKLTTIEEFTHHREQMRKNTKYSYLGANINLTHEYEQKNLKEDKRQYSYLDYEEIKDETLKKPYNVIKVGDEAKSYKLTHGNQGVRRYNYLFD